MISRSILYVVVISISCSSFTHAGDLPAPPIAIPAPPSQSTKEPDIDFTPSRMNRSSMEITAAESWFFDWFLGSAPIGGQATNGVGICHAGGGPLLVNSASLVASDEFYISGNGCNNSLLTNGQCCFVYVTYRPREVLGDVYALLTFQTNIGPHTGRFRAYAESILDIPALLAAGYTIDADGNILAPNGQPLTLNGYPVNACSPYGPWCGKPVNLSNGIMWHHFNDLTIRGRTATTELSVRRTYLSLSLMADSDFGKNWFHNWETRLLSAEGSVTANLIWVNPQGGAFVFKRSGNTFLNPPGFYGKLREYGDRYELEDKGGIRYVFSKNRAIAPIGKLISLVDPHGDSVTLSYASDGTLKTVQAPFAGTLEFVRDEKKHVIRIDRIRDGLSYQFGYNSEGRLTSSSDFENHTTEYEYAPSSDPTNSGLLSVIRDPLRREIRSIFDSQGRVIEQHEPGNAVRTFSYANAGSGTTVTTVDEIDRGITRYSFDSRQLPIQVEYPDGTIEAQVWNSRNLLTRKQTEGANSAYFTYDPRGNVSSVQMPGDYQPTYIEYDGRFDRPIRITPPVGAPTKFVIDDRTGDVKRVERSSGSSVLALDFEYDVFGNRIRVSNGLGSYGDLTDANGLKTNVYDARNPESRSYDSRGRLKARSFKSGRKLAYAYDDFDRLVHLDDSHGPDTSISYDIVGRVLKKTLSDGAKDQVTVYSWDVRDRLVEVVDPLGNRKSYEYDETRANRVLDQPVTEIDASGNRTRYSYDSRQRVSSIMREDGKKTSFTYDVLGHLASVTDASGNISYLFHDGNGRLSYRLFFSVGGASREQNRVFDVLYYVYDDGGRLYRIERSNSAGGSETIEYTYDAWDRVVQKTTFRDEFLGDRLIEGTSTFRYSPQLDRTLLIEAKNEVAVLSFAHDLAPPFLPKNYGLKSTVSGNPLNLVEGSFSIERDVSNEISLVKELSSGKSVFSAQHDSAGRLLQIASGNLVGPAAGALSFNLAYDEFGRRTTLQSSDKTRQVIEYDDLNRLRSMAWTDSNASKNILTKILSNLLGRSDVQQEMSYDPVGNIVGQKREFGSFDYSYDSLHQLTEVDAKGKGAALSSSHLNRSFDQRFEYDASGNRTLASLDGGNAEFLNNQILSNDSSSFEYDPNGYGQITVIRKKNGRSARKFNYRIDGKLSSFELVVDSDWDGDSDENDAIATKANYYYDALGRRIAKRVVEKKWERFANSKGTRKRKLGSKEYIYTQTYGHLSNEDRIVLAKDAEGTLSLYLEGKGIDEHFGRISKREKKVFLTDHLGSVLNSPLGGEFKAYGAFGTSTHLGNLFSQIRREEPVMYGFTGRQFDPESGLYYYRARMYDPSLGRFTTRDPIGFAGGDANLYRYVLNRPLVLRDSLGLAPGDVFGSATEAAQDFFKYVNSTSIAINLEFAGWLFQIGSGFTYTTPQMGTPSGSYPGLPPPNFEAVIHTHGAYDPEYANEFFSPADLAFAKLYNVDIWVATPGGHLNRYDIVTGETLPGGSKNACGP